MKKLFIFIVILLTITACGKLHRVEYECVIEYVLDTTHYTDTVILHMSEQCTPVVVCTSCKEIIVTAVPSDIWHQKKVVYQGSLPCSVNKFLCKPIRRYESSRW